MSRELRRKAGEVRYLEPSIHTVENLSEAAYETILVELKGSPRVSQEMGFSLFPVRGRPDASAAHEDPDDETRAG